MNTDQWKVSDVNKKGGEIQRTKCSLWDLRVNNVHELRVPGGGEKERDTGKNICRIAEISQNVIKYINLQIREDQ